MNKYQESLNYIIDKYIDMHYEGQAINEDTKHALRLQELVNKAESFEWIPVSERLPEPKSEDSESDYNLSDVYLVSVKVGKKIQIVRSLWDGRWFCDPMCRVFGVKAWMLLPEPYKENEDE